MTARNQSGASGTPANEPDVAADRSPRPHTRGEAGSAGARKGTIMAAASCSHLEAITTVKHPKHRQCDECVKIGAQWVHLRTCQDCGVTLCCDSSPNRH